MINIIYRVITIFKLFSLMYLYNPSLEHATHEEEWVRWPLEILHRVKAGVEVDNLKCCHLTDHQSVLWAAGNISAIWRELHQVFGLLKCLREVHDAYNGCAQWFLCEENTQQSLWLLQSTLVSSLSKLSVGVQVTRTLWDSIWISKPLLIHIHPYLSCILQRLRHGPRRAQPPFSHKPPKLMWNGVWPRVDLPMMLGDWFNGWWWLTVSDLFCST